MIEADRGPNAPIVRPVPPWRSGLIAVLYWVALVPLTVAPRHSGNVWSRYMTAESLVERGTLAIDRSPLRVPSGSPDQIRVGNHLYSDKPPVLSVLAAGLYAPLHAAGVRMSVSAGQFVAVNLVLVAGIVGLASALAVGALRSLLQTATVAPEIADALALAFAFTSQLLTYAVTFNNHSVAAGLGTAALALVALEQRGPRIGRRRLLAGMLAGLAAAVDLPAGGALGLGLLGWLAARARLGAGSFLAGLVGPLLVHAGLQVAVTGSPLPAEMTPEVFAYPGSYWTTPAGRWVEPGPRRRFGLELLLGPQGWLTVTPALAFGLVGLTRIATRRGDPLRPPALAVGGGVLVLVGYYVWGVRRTDFAGLSFGTRHLLPLAPAVYLFAVVALARWRSRLLWGAFALALTVGGVYAVAGLRDPWSRIERRDDAGLRLVKPLTLYPWSSYRR